MKLIEKILPYILVFGFRFFNCTKKKKNIIFFWEVYNISKKKYVFFIKASELESKARIVICGGGSLVKASDEIARKRTIIDFHFKLNLKEIPS